MKLGNLNKWSFTEMTANDTGRTSATKSAGIFVIFIGGICFLIGCVSLLFIDHSIDIVSESVVFTSLGAALLGVKNISAGRFTQGNTSNNGTGNNPPVIE